MKGAMAILGVIVVGAAAYFIAKGKSTPTTTSGKTPNGNSLGQQVQKQLASQLLTSQNMASLGGLVNSILPSGGSAKAATPAGNGLHLVTEADIAPKPAPSSSGNGLEGIVTTLDDSE